MTGRPAPTVEWSFQHTGLPVSDVPAAVEFYTKRLGFALGFTWGEPPSIAGVNLGEAQIFLEKGTPDPAGCTLYGMSLSSCLEEILLHTNEPLGDGVASLHTKSQLRSSCTREVTWCTVG